VHFGTRQCLSLNGVKLKHETLIVNSTNTSAWLSPYFFCRRQLSTTSFLFASAVLPQLRTKETQLLMRNQHIDFASFLKMLTQQT